jgi:hypothetical protein
VRVIAALEAVRRSAQTGKRVEVEGDESVRCKKVRLGVTC